MEQLTMNAPFEIDGLIDSGGTRKPFTARILPPKPSEDGAEYSCLVHAPTLFKNDKEIFGVDAEQARQLAVEFLKSMLAGRSLLDKAGKKIDLDGLA
jgi:hypothetical protein